jgi:hypothetical protein
VFCNTVLINLDGANRPRVRPQSFRLQELQSAEVLDL